MRTLTDFIVALLCSFCLIAGCGDGSPQPVAKTDEPLQLLLTSKDDGSLKQLTFNRQKLGNGDRSFQKLRTAVTKTLKGNEKQDAREREVDIVADERLRFEFVYNAIDACAGRYDEKTELWVSRIEKIRLIASGTNGQSVVPRGSFISLPLGEINQGDILIPDIRVRLDANEDGSLKMLKLGRRELGNDELAFPRLNNEILKIIGRPSNPLTADIEVSIDADKALRFQYVVEAINACHGRLDPKTKQWVVFIKQIGFAGIGLPAPDDESEVDVYEYDLEFKDCEPPIEFPNDR